MISKSNHVKFARFVLLGVSEEAKKNYLNFSVQCIIKQLLDSVFVIFRIIEVSVRVISLSLRLRLITPTSTSIILDITKTSSNNCLIHPSVLRRQAAMSLYKIHRSYSFVLICGRFRKHRGSLSRLPYKSAQSF